VRRWAGALIAILVAAAAAGLVLWFIVQPRTRGHLELARVTFASLPGWKNNDPGNALAAFRRSCGVVLRLEPDRPMGGLGYAGTAGDWRDVCSALPQTSDKVVERKWFETQFVPFAARAGDQSDALFTGYYEPQIRASRTRHDGYSAPIYGTPRDLLTADLGLFRSELAGVRISGHAVGAHFVPFPTRAEIDAAGLSDAPVLLYTNDPVSAFFVHIQGSGRAQLDDGSMLRLAYAGQNGRPYTPIGRVLIEKGDLDRAHMSMQAIRAWLLSHPKDARSVMESDQSYVFFRELPIGDPQLGSPGTEGVPLTPEASIAIDPGVHALGVPIYVLADAPAADFHGQPRRFARLCIGQDTGGAIKGPVRADIYWGFGARAESIAGRMKSGGRMYVLLPKALAAHIGSRFGDGR
jgi:membrane-bound lytic murein transglycosylase A